MQNVKLDHLSRVSGFLIIKIFGRNHHPDFVPPRLSALQVRKRDQDRHKDAATTRFPRLQLRRKTYDSISTLSGPTRSDFKQRVGETIFVSKKWTFFEKEDADSTICLMSMKFINSKIPIKIMLEIQTKQQSRKSCQGNDNDDIWYYINQLEHAFWCQDKYDINSNSKGITCGFKQENPPVLSFRHQDEEGAEFPEGLTHFTQIRVSHEIKNLLLSIILVG